MKKEKVLGNILFWMTLISPMISFSLASMIGEAEIFGVAGIIRYSWLMILFIPVGILSILIGLQLKKNKQKYKNNVLTIEDKIDIELPDEIKVATNKLDLYNISYVKIIDNECKDAFEKEIESTSLWKNELNYGIKNLLPLDIQYESETFDYFVFYNITSSEYNMVPLSGQYECIFIAYDCDLQRLIILNDYKINIK